MRLCVLFILVVTSFSSLASVTPQDLAKLPTVSNPQISPDGKSVAFAMNIDGAFSVVMKDLSATPKNPPGAVPMNGAHLSWFRWVNNERLLIAIRMSDKHFRAGMLNFVRIFSIDRFGKNPVYFDMEANKWKYRLLYPHLIHLLPDDNEHVLLALDPVKDGWKPQVHKVNVYTGEKELVYSNRKGFRYVFADNKGEIRGGVRTGVGTGTDIITYVRKPGEKRWNLLQQANFISKDRLRPVRFDYDDDNILIYSSAALEDDNYDQDDTDLFRYNVVTGESMGEHKEPFHEKYKKVLKKSFPGKRVRLVSSTDKAKIGKGFYAIYADDTPTQYVLYDTDKKRVDFFADSQPQLAGKTFSKMEETSYTARDGLNIPAYLTLPQPEEGKKAAKVPAIIFAHGGPWARDYWRFNNYVQFFASKGYAVLQPQFRGSTGFGHEHFLAGNAQWGLKIQDDISDGVKWLIDQGIADPEKICIVGASFGGYAAGMGLAKTPELYRCGISINGVLDMKLFNRSVMRHNEYNQALTNSQFSLKSVSPYHLRKKIEAPLLLIAGEKDSVVEPKHSYKMEKALSKKKKPVELVKLPDGEHWRTIEKNEITTFLAMDKFLSEHLD